MWSNIQPTHLALMGAAMLGTALGLTATGHATIEQDKYCSTSPMPGHTGNCSCESAGSTFACAQSIGAMHTVYQCMTATGIQCSTPTTSCGKKWDCSPYLCSDPNRTGCREQNHNCQDPPHGDLMYGCVTL